MAKGPFEFPIHPTQSCNGARREYLRQYLQEWPGSDQDLRELAREFRSRRPTGSCADFIIVMRERSL